MEHGMSWHRPPRGAELLAAAFLPDALQREAMLGDLAEEYQLVASQQGTRAADRWYLSQVTRSLFPLAIMAVRADGAAGPLRFVLNVMAGLVAVSTLVPLSFSAVGWLAAFASGGEYIHGVLAFGQSPAVVYSWWAFTCIITGIGAGYTLARVGGRSGVASAITLGLLCIPLSAITLAVDSGGATVWYEVALSAVILPAIVCGTLLRVRSEVSIERT
jgi:hypothetical protein